MFLFFDLIIVIVFITNHLIVKFDQFIITFIDSSSTYFRHVNLNLKSANLFTQFD